jgi:hypothetical protein
MWETKAKSVILSKSLILAKWRMVKRLMATGGGQQKKQKKKEKKEKQKKSSPPGYPLRFRAPSLQAMGRAREKRKNAEIVR